MNAPRMTARQTSLFTLAALGISAMGILLRLYGLGYRSLWFDEARLANGIIHHSLGTILTYPYQAKPPFMFAVAARWLVVVLGHSEIVLRLLPVLMGIGTILLIYCPIRKIFGPDLALYASALVAFSPSLIYYSKEFKQYSGEAFFTVALFLAGLTVLRHRERPGAYFLYTILGTLVIGFSYSAVFTLLGVNIALLTSIFLCGGMFPLRRLGAANVCVITAWLLMFTLYASKNATPVLAEYWAKDFADTQSLGGFAQWNWEKLKDMSQFFVPVKAGGIFLATSLVFGLAVWKPQEYCYLNVCFLATLFLILAASAMKAYPAGNRLMLFIGPLLYLVMAKGVATATRLIKKSKRRALVYFVAALVPILMLSYAVENNILRPQEREEMRPVVRYLQKNMRQGDRVYVYYGAAPAFTYYYSGTDTNVTTCPPPRNDPEIYIDDLDIFLRDQSADRFWIVFSHCRGKVNERSLILKNVKKKYTLVDKYARKGAYLYYFKIGGGNENSLKRE